MDPASLPRLDAPALLALARSRPSTPCEACQALDCPGWESLPSAFDRAALQRIATLRDPDPDADEPTFAEHHPAGSHAWSPEAPIAPAYFPYNRCEVWQCAACTRPFLRYTEYGGYYVDERIRALDPARVVDLAA